MALMAFLVSWERRLLALGADGSRRGWEVQGILVLSGEPGSLVGQAGSWEGTGAVWVSLVHVV